MCSKNFKFVLLSNCDTQQDTILRTMLGSNLRSNCEPCNMRRNNKHASVCPANLVVVNVFLALHICDGSSCLSYFSVALIKYHEQKQLGVEKVYFTLQSSGHFHC